MQEEQEDSTMRRRIEVEEYERAEHRETETERMQGEGIRDKVEMKLEGRRERQRCGGKGEKYIQEFESTG